MKPLPSPDQTQQSDFLFAAKDAGNHCEPFDELRNQVLVCQKCRLGHLRTNAVFGSGAMDADLLFVGEAPGAAEDKSGWPFVGRAGQILTRELAVHGISRDEIFISNIVKCRPPDNRDPKPDEIAACSPYLYEQIALLRPQMICALGRYAAASLLGRPVKITQEHGQWLEYRGIPFLIAIHPSAAMRSSQFKTHFTGDIAALANRYRQLPGRQISSLVEK